MDVEELSARIERIRMRMAEACRRAGRDPADVSLLAVSKTIRPEMVTAAAECGLCAFGESRVQEAGQKIPLCPAGLEWHMIGHLQRNKARGAAAWFSMIHGVDSLRLIDALDAACAEVGRVMPVCLEVNVSGERSKFGFIPEDLPGALEHCTQRHGLEVRGLMTIPPFDPNAEAGRPFFGRLRELRDRLRECTGFPLEDLSMGMSHDFESAILEGATWIRIGTAIFGDR